MNKSQKLTKMKINKNKSQKVDRQDKLIKIN